MGWKSIKWRLISIYVINTVYILLYCVSIDVIHATSTVLYRQYKLVLFTVVNIIYDDLDDFIQLTRYYYDGSIQY